MAQAMQPVAASREACIQAARDAYGRLLALLVARSRDIATSEDALADAFEAALTTWPRDAQQPGVGLVGNAVGGPAFERARERIGKRIFGCRNVVRARRKDREEPPIRLARCPFGGPMSRRVVHAAAVAVAVKTGRTSTPPLVAHGARAAHSRAASRSATSITK